MGLTNDERGWVMTSLSGVACVLGASVICVDIIVRQFPGKQDFRIQDSDSFLSASLSLSFGVMLFSSLFSMLPSSKSSLMDSGYDAKTATWIMMACFLGGFIGIQVVSRVLHKFMPSHVVDCEHTHDDDEHDTAKEHGNGHVDHEAAHSSPRSNPKPRIRPRSSTKNSLPGHMPHSPLPVTKVRQSSYFGYRPTNEIPPAIDPEARQTFLQESASAARTHSPQQRPSFHSRITSRLARLASGRSAEQCGSDDGPCRGFSDICGSECFKKVNARGGTKLPSTISINGSMRGTVRRAKSVAAFANETTPLLHHTTCDGSHDGESAQQHISTEHHTGDVDAASQSRPVVHTHESNAHDDEHEHEASHHHHHVPTNAFLSIGLQTSIAIALHKLPEGFITYATNHANPQLGVSVFLALFIHNITEGFAMALPLYLAINSRVKAMFWSFVLGGLSQPLGAGVAAVWFAVAGNGKYAPDEGIYGGMFAATAGIMVSVALQLFSEALDLTHSRTLCMVGAISGMTILGISSALTAK